MEGKKILILGLCLWFGGVLIGGILNSALLLIPTIGLVMAIVGVVKLTKERKPKVARNIRVARKVK